MSTQEKQDLRKHHFHLGSSQNGPDQHITEAKRQFQGKEPRSDMGISLNNIEANKCNIQNVVGADPKNYYQSIYGENYENFASRVEHHTKQDLQKKLQLLRSSNILMGNDCNKANTTIFKEHFSPKELNDDHIKLGKKLKDRRYDDNIFLGGNDDSYMTTKQSAYGKHDIDPALFDMNAKKQQCRELRASHFSLGRDNTNYDSEAKSNFGKNIQDSHRD